MTRYSDFVHEIQDAVLPVISDWAHQNKEAWNALEAHMRTSLANAVEIGKKINPDKIEAFYTSRKEIRDMNRIIDTIQGLMEDL